MGEATAEGATWAVVPDQVAGVRTGTETRVLRQRFHRKSRRSWMAEGLGDLED